MWRPEVSAARSTTSRAIVVILKEFGETETTNPKTMKSEIVKKNPLVIHFLVATSTLLPLPLMAQQINRTVLPVPEPQPPTITKLDARNVKPPPRFEVKAPTGRANE